MDITKILSKLCSRPITLIIYNYRATVIQSLEENGYAVIPNVLDISDCDLYIKEYKDWAQRVEDTGITISSFESLIQGHRIGHFNASWCVRLKVKDVFAQIWQTDKLLSSVDAMALSYPPEQGQFYLVKRTQIYMFVCLMVFNATFNNISLISWRSVLLLEETVLLGEIFDLSQVTDKLFHIMLYTSP